MNNLETTHVVNVLNSLLFAFESQCRKLDDNPTYWDAFRNAKELANKLEEALNGPSSNSDS